MAHVPIRAWEISCARRIDYTYHFNFFVEMDELFFLGHLLVYEDKKSEAKVSALTSPGREFRDMLRQGESTYVGRVYGEYLPGEGHGPWAAAPRAVPHHLSRPARPRSSPIVMHLGARAVPCLVPCHLSRYVGREQLANPGTSDVTNQTERRKGGVQQQVPTPIIFGFRGKFE